MGFWNAYWKSNPKLLEKSRKYCSSAVPSLHRIVALKFENSSEIRTQLLMKMRYSSSIFTFFFFFSKISFLNNDVLHNLKKIRLFICEREIILISLLESLNRTIKSFCTCYGVIQKNVWKVFKVLKFIRIFVLIIKIIIIT